jgi:hypothetical protein
MTPTTDERLARVEERGNGVFVVVLSADTDGREKDLRSFCVERDARHDPMRQKALRFAERVNTAAEAWLQGKVDDVLEKVAEKILCNGHKIGCVCGACVETKRASEIVRSMKSKGA